MEVPAWLSGLRNNLVHRRHRAIVILEGSVSWAYQQYALFVEQESHQNSSFSTIIYSEDDRVEGQINRKTYTHHLGTEQQVIFFVDPELNVDALAALSGTLAGGGILLLWKNEQSTDTHFINRFQHFILQSTMSFVIHEQSSSLPDLPKKHDISQHHIPVFEEQRRVVDHLIDFVESQRKNALVLTADRGRGKSSALAIAAAKLLVQGAHVVNLVITAPNRTSLGIFFEQLDHQLKHADGAIDSVYREGRWTVGINTLEYLPIDQALLGNHHKRILFVDEAAGVPVYILKQLLQQYQQCIYSSTVYGYEGAGKGFTLKFLPFLQAHYPHTAHYHMQQAIRWNDDDPLEQLIFDTCLLNAELAEVPKELSVDSGKIWADAEFRHIEQRELTTNENLLRQIFAVLVTAHYQTKPSDLKLLLDNPNVSIFVLQKQGHIVAVALTMTEGQLDSALVEAVKIGKRRLKNHFLPQSILTQCLREDAFDYSFLRVIRIAVHPQWQSAGLGTYLLNEIECWAKSKAIDCLGTSFAASVDVCKFWFNADYKPARIGFKADASSGEHSILMLKGLTPKAVRWVSELNDAFNTSFDYLLTDEYKHLNVRLVQLVLSYSTCSLKLSRQMSEQDNRHVQAFVKGHSQYSYCVVALHKWLVQHFRTSSIADDDALLPLIERILMKHAISDISERYQLNGKKGLNQYLINTIKHRLTA